MAAGFHDVFLTMTTAAGCWDVGMADARLRVARGQQLMRAAVTGNACGRLPIACLNGFRMIAAVVGSLLVGMASRTGNLGRSIFVGRSLYVGMAVDAGEHSSMDRSFKSVGIDGNTDLLAANVLGHGGIAVAG